jgi:hypothetical protein
MPRPRPPYLSHERTRHGMSVWYVRRAGKRIRIKAAFGTPDFDAQYQAAIAAGTSSTRTVLSRLLAESNVFNAFLPSSVRFSLRDSKVYFWPLM